MPAIAAAGAARMEPQALLESLRDRYAVKRFDPSQPVSPQAWEALESALVLAPSSFGLQPWKFFVVDDPEVRARLKPASWGQGQVTDADKLVVFGARKDFGPADVERFVTRMAEVRGVPASSLDGYKQMMLGALARPRAEVEAWVARQVYLALGVFLTSAAALGVDACPMEGIEPAKYDEILGLGGQGYTALCVAAAGHRAADDGYARARKVRYLREEVVAHI